MISLIYGLLIGRFVKNYKVGLAVLLIPVVVLAIIIANVSHNDGAGLLIPVWALIGFAIGKIIKRPSRQQEKRPRLRERDAP